MTIFETREYGKKNKKVIFILIGWRAKIWPLWIVTKILESNGYYCICYFYDNSILSPDIKTVANVQLVKGDILDKISNLKKKGYTKFSIIAASFGTLIALLVSNESKDIKKVLLSTSGADPAATVWTWDRVDRKVFKDFKEKLLQQNLTLQKLQKMWKPIIPLYHMDNLQDKKILVCLSKKDKIIPFSIGMELIHAFQKRNYDYKLIVNTRFGHFFTTVYYCLNVRMYLKFLSQ